MFSSCLTRWTLCEKRKRHLTVSWKLKNSYFWFVLILIKLFPFHFPFFFVTLLWFTSAAVSHFFPLLQPFWFMHDFSLHYYFELERENWWVALRAGVSWWHCHWRESIRKKTSQQSALQEREVTRSMWSILYLAWTRQEKIQWAQLWLEPVMGLSVNLNKP